MKMVSILQVIIAILLVVTILLQNRGSGLSAVFGGDFGGYHAKRGLEKFLLYFSIVLSILFIALSIGNIILING